MAARDFAFWVRDNQIRRRWTFQEGRNHSGGMNATDFRSLVWDWRKMGYATSESDGAINYWRLTDKGFAFLTVLAESGSADQAHAAARMITNAEAGRPNSSAPLPPAVLSKIPFDYLDYDGNLESVTKTTIGALFGKKDPSRIINSPVTVWQNHPKALTLDPNYIWPEVTLQALTQIRRGRNVAFYGPASTGKTSWVMNFSAALGRPFTLISGDGNLEAPELIGMTVPDGNGGVRWQDGQLLAAMRIPGMVICLDEPSIVRPSALFVFQNILQNREYVVRETGEHVKCAPGVMFFATDNTNGRGGGNRAGYTDTNRLNAATIDRFGVWLEVPFLPPKDEQRALVSRSGCTGKLAELLVEVASATRKDALGGKVSAGLSFRRLVAWAEQLMDGIPAEKAAEGAILNSLPDLDRASIKALIDLKLTDKHIAPFIPQ